jgi:hypothetical protein
VLKSSKEYASDASAPGAAEQRIGKVRLKAPAVDRFGPPPSDIRSRRSVPRLASLIQPQAKAA